MINASSSNINTGPGESASNNSFSSGNDARRSAEKGSENLEGSKGIISAQPGQDQMTSTNFYQQNQQINSQENHTISGNGYPNSASIPMAGQSYPMQYSMPSQGGVTHNGLPPSNAYPHMHTHGMTGNDSYMQMQPASSMPQQYMAHPNASQGPGGGSNVGGNSAIPISQHAQHHSQVSHTPSYNHIAGASVPMQGQQDQSHLNPHMQGQGQQGPPTQYASLMHRGYMSQPMTSMPGHVGMPLGSTSQSSMYSLQGQGSQMYQQPPQMPMTQNVSNSGAVHNQQMPMNQPPATNSMGNGLPQRFQPKMWHSNEHQGERSIISDNIVSLLKSRRPNAAENWTDKLPQMAKKLEDALYHEAENFEEYKDRATLKARLQKLAIQMGNGRQAGPVRTGSVPNQQAAPAQQAMGMQNRIQPQANGPPNNPISGNGLGPNVPAHPGQYPNGGQYQQPQMLGPPGSNYIQQPNYANQTRMNTNQPSYPHMMHNPNQPMQMSAPPGPHSFHPGMNNGDYSRTMGLPPQQQLPGGGSGQYPVNPDMNQHPNYVNSMNSLNHGMMVPPQQGPQGGSFSTMDSSNNGMMSNVPNGQYMFHVGSNGAAPGGSNMMQMSKKPVPVPTSNPMQQSGVQLPLMVGNPGAPGAPPTNSDEHRKQVLKQQQQRLLLLRHASKCPHENNRCPVTPHCWGMKQLWKHIMSCKDQDCKVPHCVSSRYVLSHYSKCKEPQCPVCGPVRDAIKKNYERSKEVAGIVSNPQVGRAPAPVSSTIVEGKANHPAPVVEEPVKKKRKTNDQSSKNTTLVIRPPPPPPAPAPPKRVYPLDPISSAIYTFDVCQIEAHIKSIQEGLRVKVSKIKEICKPLIDELYKIQYVQDIFGTPVDYVALSLPDYPEKVKCPMDLGTVTKKMESGSYRDFEQMASDVRLTFDNAMLYNPVGSEIHRIAKNAKKDFNDKFNKKITDFERKISEDRQNNDACTICGEIKLEFAPPVLYCSGTCARAIKRGSWYYSNKSGSYFWCPPCFNSLKASEPIQLPDCTISKSELEQNRKQHNEVHPESWVECDGGCGRWVHQICSLFNSRRNVQDLPFVCPLCVKDKKHTEPNNANIVMPVTKPMKACDLPRTVLSDFLEKRIQKRLEIAYEEAAANQNTTPDKVERCPSLTLRQVSCVDKDQDVREGFLSRYKDKGYPTSFPCRVKCLVLFQNIDGQDVILFGMYVYEYGHNCPEPNQRRVYVSYLDSVHYLRPKQYRTLVYHEILISYLDYVKARGFHTAHIWACPPQKGDDYILHIHPFDQKTPKPQTLRIWYEQMLKRCVERGIVVDMTDLHTEYLTEANNDATIVPYFEGDYWVNEAEVIIKNLSEGKKGASISNFDDNAGQAKRKSKAKRAADSKDVVGNTVSRLERDPLLAKMSGIIEPMKDTFFVARLHPKEYAERFKSQPQPDSAAEEGANSADSKQDVLSRDDVDMPTIPEEPAKESNLKLEPDTVAMDDKDASGEENGNPEFVDFPPETPAMADVAEEAMDVDAPVEISSLLENPNLGRDESIIESKEDAVETAESPKSNANEPEVISSGNAQASETETQAVVSVEKRTIMCGEDMPVLPDNTEDVDEPQQNEHFETRQSFLNLCQGNHYQFDQLRRAKHSSMMVLYHLHNPDAPKFVPTCTNCKESILQQAYHCRSCEIDFCQTCVAQQGPRIHNHPLQLMGSAPQIVTEEQRKERERSIKLHMQLLSHAANCGGCESKNCARMKEFLNHESSCDKKVAGGCRICSRMSNLLHLHARQCKVDNCKVPHCISLREQFRKLQMSQMQMDDRRRQQMNLEYNRGTQKSRGDDDDD